MRIAFLSPFYPYRGGIAQFSDRLLIEMGKNCEIKAFSYSTLYPKLLFPGKSQTVPSPDPDKKKSLEVLSSVNPFSAIQTAREINRYNPDVLIVAYWMFFFVPVLSVLFRLLKKKIKIVGLVHNAIAHESPFVDKPLARLFLSQCDAVVCMSESVKGDVLKLNPKARVLVDEHPIYDHYGDKISTDEARQSLSLSKEKRTLLFFGLIRDYKGLDLLIKAMSYLNADYQLVIAGECYGSFASYQELIDASPIKENIHVFQEYISDDRVGSFFSAADILVLPYKSATQSGVLSIAYHFLTPVVATNVGGLGTPILQNEIGLLAEQPTPEALAKAIRLYFEENSLSFIKNIESQKERLSWRSYSQRLLQFLERY